MNKNGITIWLNQDIQIIKKNILNNIATRPLLAGANETTLTQKLITLLANRKQVYIQSNYCLHGDEITIENLEKIIIQYA